MSSLCNLYITGQMAFSDKSESLNLTSESSELTPTKNPWKTREIVAQMSRKALSETPGIPEVVFTANAYTVKAGEDQTPVTAHCQAGPWATQPGCQ